MSLHAVQIIHLGAARAASSLGGTCASPAFAKRPSGPPAAPPDLQAFVCSLPVSDVVRALGLAAGTISRLRHGYWPADSRKIIKAWDGYRASRGVVASSWFLRRVRPGGLVCHAGRHYTALQLCARTGQLLAVAREEAGGLVAQTLELPAMRLPLTPVEETGGVK